MTRITLLWILAIFACQAYGQYGTCQFTLTAKLVDGNLNLKPIPKLKLNFREVDAITSHPIVTSFEGEIKAELPCGKYEIRSESPTVFEGKTYSWDFTYQLVGGTPNQIELSVDNAASTPVQADSPKGVQNGRVKDDLVSQFKRYEGSVVTVWSETGHGTGFFFDDSGLVLTNDHVVEGSEYIAVQSDPEHKIAAVLLAEDRDRDVAVLWAQRSALPETVIAPLANPSPGELLAEEGEKVFTIGSPLNQTKIMTTGIVSKVEKTAIISDININHGNSGGPLFNSLGRVIGITTFGDTATEGGPGISGIVRIEQAEEAIVRAKQAMKTAVAPSSRLLPVEPEKPFPVEGLKASLEGGKVDLKPYTFDEGDYTVAILTPAIIVRLSESKKLAAKHEKSKRLGKAATSELETSVEFRNWADYVGMHQAVIQILATPKLKETFGSALARGMTARNGYSTIPAKLRYKTDFYKMILRCGDKEIEPIFPGRIQTVTSVNNVAVRVNDIASEGLYTYTPDAISPSCGDVSLDIYSEKNVLKAKVKGLNDKTIKRVWDDFAQYRAAN
jgi:S1-C subfamily serine protease